MQGIYNSILSKLFNIFYTLIIATILLSGCSSYFYKMKHIKVSAQTLSQSSRIALFMSNDNSLEIATRLTYLNELDSISYNNREYFFLEIFNESDEVIVPDSLKISLFNKKPMWIRKISKEELDDILVLENDYSEGYLIAFKKAPLLLQRRILVELSITNFGTASYDFSYKVMNSEL
ncbi:hypothetical protein LS73_004845 [Helicobacter muridarum]|uniref:Putative lipoprotein n=1 Tax=Helicobacter muridarum TaxID=216 RepID=A0A099TZY1_9HELI|nr:hypothetical protein [Helicobacter muridarum]TLE00319.1 hypothetical protein LS73_004845 [Helicobacter muridarum]STQ85816.1 putative lipoprotein [Helicobacter muridarum]